MELDIRIPAVGESVQEALLAEWFRADGDAVGAEEFRRENEIEQNDISATVGFQVLRGFSRRIEAEAEQAKESDEEEDNQKRFIECKHYKK